MGVTPPPPWTANPPSPSPRSQAGPGPSWAQAVVVISHIVLFTPKDSVAGTLRESFALKLRQACLEIPGIKHVTVGRTTTIDAGYTRFLGNKTYEFAAVFDFDSESELRAYLQHPLHRELGQLFWDLCSVTTVVEVQSVDPKSADFVSFLVG